MLTQNLISSKALIAELFSDFNIEGTDWVTKANRHIARAIQLMQLDGYYKRSFSFRTVTDYMCPLPCENKNLIGVLALNGNVLTRLDIKSNFYIGKEFQDLTIHSQYKASLNNGVIITNFTDVKIGLLYFAIPVDNDGNPLIIDNPFVLEALPFYIIMRLGYSGYVHPVISREEAEQKWNLLMARARNNVNYPTIEEMENFTRMNTDPYYSYYPDPNFEDGYSYTENEALDVLFLRQLHLEA